MLYIARIKIDSLKLNEYQVCASPYIERNFANLTKTWRMFLISNRTGKKDAIFSHDAINRLFKDCIGSLKGMHMEINSAFVPGTRSYTYDLMSD